MNSYVKTFVTNREHFFF